MEKSVKQADEGVMLPDDNSSFQIDFRFGLDYLVVFFFNVRLVCGGKNVMRDCVVHFVF